MLYPCHVGNGATELKLSCKDTETSEARYERIETIAKAIDYASDRATCSGQFNTPDCKKQSPFNKVGTAAVLLETAIQESRFAQNIHEGNCSKNECDSHKLKDGTVAFKARTFWQLHESKIIEDEWDEMVGTSQEATNAAAWAAIKTLNSAYWTCGGTVDGMFSAYAGVSSCNWEKATYRKNNFERQKRNLQAKMYK